MKHLLNAACVALLAASPCLGSGPPSDGGGPVTSQRDRDARAAFAFAASFARQRAEPVKHGDSHSLPDDPAVRVWSSTLPTYYPGQPEPAPVYQAPVYVPPVSPFAPAFQRVSFGGGRRGTVCVGGT
jgi:hypothetical protein